MDYSLDKIDLTILSSLQTNARLQNSELAKKCGMAPSAVLERVKKLEQKGIIKDYDELFMKKREIVGVTFLLKIKTKDVQS